MQQPLISVVVPIYKVEKYLPRCIESVLGQTYANIEAILVEDCSPDRCGEICDRAAASDPRVKAVHRERNGGLAAARNTGMDAANGEYIFFIDSDDWLAQDTLEYLYAKMLEYDADIAVGGTVTVIESDDGGLDYQERVHAADHLEDAAGAMRGVLLRGSSSCNRLYRRDAFNVRFPEGRINEDEPAVLRVYAGMKRILFLDRDTYFYRKRKDSITTSAFSMRQLDCVENIEEMRDFVAKDWPELLPEADFKRAKVMMWCYVNLLKIRGADSRAERRRLGLALRESLGTIWRNRYLPIYYKCLAVLCSLFC